MGPQLHPTRRSSPEIGALDTTFGLTTADAIATPPARQFVERPAGSDIEGDVVAPMTDTSVVGGARLTDLPGGWSRPAVARDTAAQPASPISAAQDQTVALNGSVIPAAAYPTHPRSSADPAGPALLDVSALNLALANSSGMDADPDLLIRPIATVASPVLGGDVVTAPVRDAARSEDPHRIISVSLPADAPSFLAGSNTLPGMRVEGSANSASSTPSPTGLADQLSYHVIKSVDNGGGEVVLQLHPPELGDLTVRVLVNGRDVSAWFASPQIQVQQAITQAIGQLHTDLGNAGYNLNSVSVGADAWSPRERDNNLPLPQQQQRGGANRSRVEESPGSSTPSAASGVSIYV